MATDQRDLSAEQIAPRPLVPTERQQARGESAEAYSFPAAPGDAPKAAVSRRARDWFARFDLRTLRGPKRLAVVLLSITFFGQMDDLVFVVIGPELISEFASGPAALATIYAVLTVVQYIVQPFYGWLVDRTSRVALLRIAHIGGNVFSTLSAFSAKILGFVGMRSATQLLGIGSGTPQATLVADTYEGESFGRVQALLQTVQQLAVVTGPLIAGFIVAATNWRVTVFILGLVAVAVSCTTLLLREPKRGEVERKAAGEAAAAEEPPLPFGEAWRIAKSVATLRRIWYVTPFAVAAGTFPILSVLALYFSQEFGLDAAERGTVAALIGAAGLIGLVVVNPIAARAIENEPGRLLAMAGSLMGLEAVALIVVGVSNVLVVSALAAIVLGFSITIVPLLVEMVKLKVVPPRIRGLGFSTTAPWAILGLLLFALALSAGVRGGSLSLAAVAAAGAVLLLTAGEGVARDMRAARASVRASKAVTDAAAAGTASLLVCRDLEVAYDGVQVLFGVDLDVREGEIVALLGTNGAGKSTVLRAIAGIHQASNGAIFLDGRDSTREPAHALAARGVALMPGGKATFPTLTVGENLRAAAWLHRDDPGYERDATEAVLGHFPVLRERLDAVAGTLSGGEQQMVGLAQAFMMRPRLLMIDELSLGLAPSVIERLLDVLRAINANGTAVILVEQSVNVALTIAPRAVFMEKGEVRFEGTTQELLQRPDLLRSVFIGSAPSSRASRPARRREKAQERSGALEVHEVSLDFGGVRALNGASLSVGAGEIVGVIGPNGAGKTTLFDVISGFTKPDAGRILLEGRDVTGASPHDRARLGIARSFQNVRLFPALTVRQNIAVALERRAVRNEIANALWLPRAREAEAKIANRVEGLVEILGLEAFADKFAEELSTGSRRAVEIACVMAAEPSLLLLDEPSSGLAQAETEELGPVLTRLVRDTGCALLIIEHDMPLVTGISDRLIAMELGRVIASGAPDEVIADERILASYLSASEGVIARSDAASPLARVAAGIASREPGKDGT